MTSRLLRSLQVVAIAVVTLASIPAPAEDYSGGLIRAAPANAASTPPATPADYLNVVLDILQEHSIRTKNIDWPKFRATTLAEGAAAKTFEDTYPAIRAALKRLGDNHSFFISPDLRRKTAARVEAAPSRPRGDRLSGPTGYINVPAFVGLTPDQMIRFADSIQDLIVKHDSADLLGWIVDLRENEGGNMWPMVAGLGPLVGEGTLGAFVAPDGTKSLWSYRNGRAELNGQVAATVTTPYRLLRPDPPVAVLIGPRTASAGEAVTLTFRGRPQSRSFGSPTNGLTTANTGIELVDGAMIWLAIAIEADRTGQQFSSVIEPDEAVTSNASKVPEDDAVVNAALKWIRAGAH